MTVGRWLRVDFLALAATLGCVLTAHPLNWLLVCLLFTIFGLMRTQPRLLFLFMCVLFVFYLIARFCSPPTLQIHGNVQWMATVKGIPNFDGDRLSLIIQPPIHQRVYATYTFQTPTSKQHFQTLLKPGERCHFTGDIQSPDTKRNPYGFDFKAYLKSQNIQSQMILQSISKCQSSDKALWARVQDWRLLLVNRTTEAFPNPLKGYVLALVFGMKSAFSPEDLTAFQTLGISHVLTVSGLHVGLMTAGALGLFRRVGVPKELGQMSLLLVVLPIYSFLAGASPSVLRAGFMIGMMVLGNLFRKSWSANHLLIGAALLLLLISPNMIQEVSFQLSFLVTYNLLMSWKILKRVEQKWLQLLLISAVSEIGLLPVTLYCFFQFSWLSMAINLIYVPWISIGILPLSFFLVFIALLFPSIAGDLAHLVNPLVYWPQGLLTACASHSWSSFSIGRLNSLEMVLLILFLGWFLMKWESFRSNHLLLVAPIFLMVTLIAGHIVVHSLNPVGRVVFIDVGQGDCIFIQLPFNRQTILIDTGGRLPFSQPAWKRQKKPFEVGRDVVLKELKGMGVNRIDILVLTHRDFDHIGGAKGLVGHIPIHVIMVSPYFVPSQAERTWLDQARQLGTQLKVEAPDDGWRFGKSEFHVLWPVEKEPTTNGRSLVIEGKMGGKVWLFTGDLEIPEEQKLIRRYPNLKVDILKVGHHGSRTASSDKFLKTIQPKLAIISVGAHNRYGHPHQEVLNRLSRLKIPYLRTDQTGAVTITFTNTSIRSIRITRLSKS